MTIKANSLSSEDIKLDCMFLSLPVQENNQ